MNKGWIFDYGGTLDSGGQHWGKVLWHGYERHGVGVTEAQFREAYVTVERTLGRQPVIQPDFTFRQTLATKVHMQLELLGMGQYEAALVDDLYARTMAHTARSREVLLRLKEQAPMVLVSNFYGNIHTVLREMNLADIFSSVIESAVVGVRKPDPRIFLLGVEALGLQPAEVTVVGDSMDKDIVPARKAGCRTVWLKGEGWTDDPVLSCADWTIERLEELLSIE